MNVIDVKMIPVLISLIVIAEVLIQQIFKPIREFLVDVSRLGPILDFLTPYVAWVLAATMCYFGEINVFGEIFAPLAGTIFTCILAGCGSNRLHDLMSGDGLARKIAVYSELAQDEPYLSDYSPEETVCCKGTSS